MYTQYLLAAVQIREGKRQINLKAARAEQSGIDEILTIRHADEKDVVKRADAVHHHRPRTKEPRGRRRFGSNQGLLDRPFDHSVG